MFRVGARVRTRLGWLNGGGRLTVAPGEIVLTLDAVTKLVSPVSSVTHTDLDVAMIRARLMPPWCDTAVVLHEGERVACAVTWFGARTQVRLALQRAGFLVHDRATWFATADRR